MDSKLVIYCITIGIITYFSIRAFIIIAPKIGLVDIPNSRSSHVKPTPRGAGIVIGLVFFIFMFVFKPTLSSDIIYPMIALLIIFICGVIDDLKTLSSKVKFVFIIVASVILVYDGYIIDHVGTYLGHDLFLATFLAVPFTIFSIVGFTNALNLTDGLDGLAGGLSSIILLALFIIGVINNDVLLLTIPPFLLAILAAFLLLNWNPAKVFMGDSGSLFLGFTIAFLSIHSLIYITPTAVLFLAAIPILDTLVVFRRRMQRGKSPFEADKNHMHHILQNTKQNVKFTVNTLIMMQAAFCLIFLQVLNAKDILNIVLFAILYLIFFNLFDPRGRRRVDSKKKKKKNKEESTYLDMLTKKDHIEEPS